jgi:pimeloyl-ACP methyl ester carboxylesterase
MKPILRAGVLYFAALFGAGFLLGVLRELWLREHFGSRAAELAEVPVMLGWALLASRFIVRREPQGGSAAMRFAMGFVAVLLILAAELALVLPLRGLAIADYLASVDPVSGAAYYGALAIIAVLPVFAGPLPAKRRRFVALCVASVLAVPLLFLWGCFARDLDAATTRLSVGSQVVQTACGPIEYASTGKGSALLLVHGAGGGFDQALDLARQFVGAGYRVVAPSRFGYLRTPLPADASPPAQADAHACLLDALKIERAVVIGVSAGAPSSLQFALRHANRTEALALLVPLAYAPREVRPIPAFKRFMLERAVQSDLLYWTAMTLAPEAVTDTILGTPPQLVSRAAPADRAQVDTMMRHILPISRRAQGLQNEARIAASLPRYELEQIVAPTLIISAQDDRYDTFIAAQYTAERIRGARFVGYRTGGHLLIGHSAEIEDELSAFLDGIPPIGLGAR